MVDAVLTMVACGLLLVVALTLIVRWRAETVLLPRWSGPGVPPVGWLVRSYLWSVAAVVAGSLLAAVLAVGPGGRLVMRLLAATSPQARGFVTEAGEVVGDISLEGTVGFFIFVGLPGAFLTGFGYALCRGALPRGPWGGALFGFLLLVGAGATVEPLRPDNPDFDIVGPGWLAVVTFTALAVLTGALVAVTVARLSRAVPARGRRALAWVPVLLLGLPVLLLVWPLGLAVLVVGVVVVVAGRRPSLVQAVRRRGPLVLRVAGAALLVLFAPGFVRAVAEIVG